MTIECVGGAVDSSGLDGSDGEQVAGASWCGRDVQVLAEGQDEEALIAQLYLQAFLKMQDIKAEAKDHRYDLLDLEEEIAEEISLNFEEYAQLAYSSALHDLSNRQLALLDLKNHQEQILLCRSLLKSAVHGLKKGAKETVKGVKKAAKKTKKFVQEHKKEILVCAAVVAVAVGAVYLAGSLGVSAASAGTAAAAAAGGQNSGGGSKRREDETASALDDLAASSPPSDPPSPKDPTSLMHILTEQQKAFVASGGKSPFNQISPLPGTAPKFSSPETKSSFQTPFSNFLQRRGLDVDNTPVFRGPMGDIYQNYVNKSPSQPLPETSTPLQRAILNFLASMRQGMNEEGVNQRSIAENCERYADVIAAPTPPTEIGAFFREGFATFYEAIKHGIEATALKHSQNLKEQEAQPRVSCYVKTEGIERSNVQVNFINGIGTSMEGYKSHAEYIKKLAGGLSVEGVYNHTNGMVVDIAEAMVLSFGGVAPITADELVEIWTKFHERNKDNPYAKAFQTCYSMGTILTWVALQKAPKEVRDRVIVVALAPAKVIPDDLCYLSFAYASRNDIVHLAENLCAFFMSGAVSSDSLKSQEAYLEIIKSKEKLVLLKRQPGSNFFDHDFQSPTLCEPLLDRLNDYLSRDGQYKE